MKTMEIIASILIVTALAVCVEVHASECQDTNWDVWKVAKALQQGLSKEDLLLHLEASRAELTPERMIRIRAMIDEAYELDPSNAERWWQSRYRTCSKEEEA